MNFVENFYKSSFISGIDGPAQFKFYGTDSLEKYEKNLKIQISDWHYRNCEVVYNINSDGFRSSEFNTVDWSNSIVAFGCSHIFGTGNSENELFCNQLSKLINLPVINMGVGGSCIYLSHMNMITLLSKYKPLAVVNAWTSFHRISNFTKHEIKKLVASNHEKNDLFVQWNKHQTHSKLYALIVHKSSNLIINSLRIPYYEFSYFDNTADLFKCDYIKHVDYARDILHYGKQTHAVAAKRAFENLKIS